MFGPRFKIGLETPLVGRFVGEDKRLVFAPPRWYENLVLACLVGGLYVFFSSSFGLGLDWLIVPSWRFWVGLAVAFGGAWATLSNERMTCDLKARAFVRWEGKGPFRKRSTGRLSDLDAVVVLAENRLIPTGPGVVYRIVLHWKQARHPLLVVGQQVCPLMPGMPLNHGAGPSLGLAHRYATALGLPLFDNTHFHSPEPLKPV